VKNSATIGLVVLLCCVLTACNQPFEPDGPVSSKLVLYSILNAASSTQYVRVSTTYQTPPGQEIHDAAVRMEYNGRTIVFRDTTIVSVDAEGHTAPVHVYVAYNQPISPGSRYLLHVSTPSGLSASAGATALNPPAFSLRNPKILDRLANEQLTLNVSFGSFTGAFVIHFYLDFYAYVEGGWELHRTEVPLSSRHDINQNLMSVYPSLALVQTLASSQKDVTIKLDTLQYSFARAEVISAYPAAPVVWLRAVFVLTQIDNTLFNYYYVNNGPVDKSSIRLDQPDYTNIPEGLGVFGSSATVTMSYPITR
jgi:hypothetical protein